MKFYRYWVSIGLLASTIRYTEAQVNKENVIKHTTGIESIDPSVADYKGYEILAQKIGDARIVMLGEQTHRHGTTFTAKTKIIRYLVENLGFEVIAFESSFYGINKLWNSENSLNERLANAKKEIYGMWSKVEETIPLFDFIEERNQNGHKLDIVGIDCIHGMPYTKENYAKDLDDFLVSSHISIPKEYSSFKPLLKRLVELDLNGKIGSDEIMLFGRVVDSLRFKLSKLHETQEIEFWNQELKSLKMDARGLWVRPVRGVNRWFSAPRDSAMAENLLWLARNKYKDKKIIVWASSYHVSKNKSFFEKSKGFDPNKLTVMGNIIDSNMPGKTYSLGFVSSQGYFAESLDEKAHSHPIRISDSSFEAILAETAFDCAIVDLRSMTNDKKFAMAGTDYFQTNAVWNKIFDGVFYIRKTSPSSYIKQ